MGVHGSHWGIQLRASLIYYTIRIHLQQVHIVTNSIVTTPFLTVWVCKKDIIYSNIYNNTTTHIHNILSDIKRSHNEYIDIQAQVPLEDSIYRHLQKETETRSPHCSRTTALPLSALPLGSINLVFVNVGTKHKHKQLPRRIRWRKRHFSRGRG